MIIKITEKRFGDKLIFSDFECEIKRGSVTAIEGPSGRGKTTLIRLASGLDSDFEGTIIDPLDCPIILFQEDRLVESISLISNLRMVSEDMERIVKLLDEIGLGGEYLSKVSELSGGMKRRAAIVRALLTDWDILFLDEPFKGLDDEVKKKAAEIIVREKRDRTIVLVSHDRIEASLLGADRFLQL